MSSIYLVLLSLTREVGIFGTWVNHCGDLEVTSEILKVQKKKMFKRVAAARPANCQFVPKIFCHSIECH